jgi:uncharacterized protein (DUF1015 family)
MAIHYPENNLKILDYNRVLKTLNGITNEQFLEKIAESYDIKGPLPDDADTKPSAKGECTLYLGNKWYSLKVKEDKIDKENLIK